MLMKIYNDEDMIKVYFDEKIGRRCKSPSMSDDV